MAAAEIAAAVTGIRAALDITKAMIGLRDAEAFRAKSIELQAVVLDAFDKAIEAREAHSAQADRIRALETEVANLKGWDAERQKYELKRVAWNNVAYMLKKDERGTEPPHWLCPNCFAKDEKTFLVGAGEQKGRSWVYKCFRCKAEQAMDGDPRWIDE